jgi:hypothetical protein
VAGATQIYSGGGLTLTAACAAGPDMTVASTGAGSIYVEWESFTSPIDADNISGGQAGNYTRNVSANRADLLASDDTAADGQLIYDANGRETPGGQNVVITFHEEVDTVNGKCGFIGSAVISG